MVVRRVNGHRHLSDEHLRLLKESALNDSAINACNSYGVWRYETVSSSVDLINLGFSDAVAAHTPGLLIRLFNRDGEIWGHQYRPDIPRRDARGNDVKYETPSGQEAQLDIPPDASELIGDRKKALIVTEGSRKADAAVSAGFCSVALIGVGIWRVFGWQSFGLSGRDVYICFDSDAVLKKEVQIQERKLAMLLDEYGAKVRVCRLTGDENGKVGLDDFLFNGGDLDALVEESLELSEIIQFEELSDLGNAKRFVALHADEIRYCDLYKSWLIWNGRFWEKDVTLQIQELAKTAVVTMRREALNAPGTDDDKKKRIKWYFQSANATRIREMVNLARSDPAVKAHPLDFDSNPYLLCVENGTLDLETGVLRDHRVTDMITHMAPVEFVPDAKDPKWEQLLDFFVRPSDDDGGIEALLQRVAYSGLCGVSEKSFVELYDKQDGHTGKTTFLQSLLLILGSYGEVVRVEAFMGRKFAGGVRSDLAACFGKRLVVSSEVPRGARLDNALIKKLTEGGKAVFQFEQKYERAFAGPITFLICIDGNDVPRADAEDSPLYGRWKTVPFTNRLPKRVRRDDRWLDKADSSSYRSAVLWWALAGRQGWIDMGGIGTTPVVEHAIAEIRRDQDPLTPYWETQCLFNRNLFTTTAALYENYRAWILGGGTGFNQKPINEKDFMALLKAKPVRNGVKKIDGKVTRGWHGIGI